MFINTDLLRVLKCQKEAEQLSAGVSDIPRQLITRRFVMIPQLIELLPIPVVIRSLTKFEAISIHIRFYFQNDSYWPFEFSLIEISLLKFH